MWWWWWSLQWWFGKCSSYLGHHYPKDVFLVHSFTLVVYVIQKSLMGLQVWISNFFCYLGWKTQLWKCLISFFLWSKNHLGVCKCANIIIFLTYVNKKSHLRVYKSAISFIFFLCKLEKPLASSQISNIIFFLYLCE